MVSFQPHGLPVLIGSLPMQDHDAATALVLKYTPEIPLWVQLPCFPQEGMVTQFLPGMPGTAEIGSKVMVNTESRAFEQERLDFYTRYMAVTEGGMSIEDAGFGLNRDTANGFFVLIDRLVAQGCRPRAVKGQITGPVTFGIGVKDPHDRSIFYDDHLRDMAVKLLALKAGWQVRQFRQFDCPAIVFFDEPGLAGFGSSAFISISREEVAACFDEVIDAVHAQGGLAGIHVCANADWSLLLESRVDIISFDAYGYFDKFILYGRQIKTFLEKGGVVAWGIVPTLGDEIIATETAVSLAANLRDKMGQVTKLGIDPAQLTAQSLITPSCGTGSLSYDLALRVLQLTREVSQIING